MDPEWLAKVVLETIRLMVDVMVPGVVLVQELKWIPW